MIKRILLWVMAVLAVLVVVTVLAFRLSPWPSVAIIQYAFSRGDQVSEDALLEACAAGRRHQTERRLW
jgi:acetyl esterase